MAETKEQIAAERDALRAETEQLRAALARAGGDARVPAAQHAFQLSEGDRQELVMRGVVSVGGRLLTREQVEARLGADQQELELGDATPDPRVLAVARQQTVGIRGVDFVYPSVAPGQIDPEVAGTPGVSGPAAGALDTEHPDAGPDDDSIDGE